MILGIITLLSALTISAVAIYYSVAGLAAIFAAAVVPIIIMGVALEVGKLVTAVWLHKHWSRAVWWLKTYLSIAVVVLMFITSMGIFGYLSKAHIEQTSLSQEQVALIGTLEDKESRSTFKIDRWTEEMSKLMKGEDVRVDNLIANEQEELDKINALIKQEKDDVRVDFDKQIQLQNDRLKQAAERKEADINAAAERFKNSLGGGAKYDKAVEVAKANELSVASAAQKEIQRINGLLNDALAKVEEKYADQIKNIQTRITDLRNQANNKTVDIESRVKELEGFIDSEQLIIDQVREQKFEYEKEYRKLEAEVGPIKYIAEFIYGDQADQNLLEAAVRWVIIVIIFVFDPLAVLLLIASQYTFQWARGKEGGSLPGKPDPDPEDPNDPDEPPYTEEEWNEAHRHNQEFDGAKKIATNVPPTISEYERSINVEDEEQKFEKSQHSSQLLMFNDIDPLPMKDREFFGEDEEVALPHPDQQSLDFDEKREDETEEEYLKRVWKKEHPQSTIEHQKRLLQEGNIESLPWEKVSETIEDMKSEGEWPKGEEEDDLDKWNEWVEAANKQAEQNPEKGKYTEVIEPQGFVQNEEQHQGEWNKIQKARRLKELEITEKEYRQRAGEKQKEEKSVAKN
tara:strand:- start:4169 stop:6052 length:1884 start_codon:yes stop_codon:yes gene_type:complete